MRSRNDVLTELKSHSVRIQDDKGTVGTGFLLVPASGEYAYILTAAHVMTANSLKYPITVQCCLGALKGDCEEGRIECRKSDVRIHSSYDKEKEGIEIQSGDSALIRVQKRDWMNGCREVFWGIPTEGMPIAAAAYSGAIKEGNIQIDTNRLYALLTNVDTEKKQMTTVLDGDVKFDPSDPDNEIGGMSGTVYAADYQDDMILVGMFVQTPENSDPLGRAYLIGLEAVRELLSQEGIVLGSRQIEKSDQMISSAVTAKTVLTESRFVHREQELGLITKSLKEGNLAILSGMGGIGKTELSRQYANQHREEYEAVLSVDCRKSILDGFSEIEVRGICRTQLPGGRYETNERLGQRVLDWLKAHGEYNCLFLLDDVSHDDPSWQTAAALLQDKVVTTRWSKSVWKGAVVEVNAFTSMEECRELFEAYLERELENEECEVFERIVKKTSGHTLTLQLIARQCESSDITLEEIYEVLEREGVYTDDPNCFSYGELSDEKNMYGHIRTIWNLSGFSECDKRIMQGMSLVSPYGVNRKKCQEWMQLTSLNEINSLVKRGWISLYREKGSYWIKVHMVIAEVIFRELYQKEKTDLNMMLAMVEKDAVNRTLEYDVRGRYYQYGVRAAERINCSIQAVVFLQHISESAEYFRDTKTGLRLLKRAEGFLRRLGQPDSILMAHVYSDTALMYQREHDIEKMFFYFDKAGQVYIRQFSRFPKAYGVHCHNVARAYLMVGDYIKAKELEIIAEKVLSLVGRDELGKVYDALAECCAAEINALMDGKRKPGEENLSEEMINGKCIRLLGAERRYWQMAVETKSKAAPDDVQEIMVSKKGLACVEALRGNTEKAMLLIDEVMEFYKKTTGEDSENAAHVYDVMCLIYENAERYDESLEYAKKAIDILIRRYGRDCPELITVYFNAKTVCDSLHLEEESRYYEQEMVRLEKMDVK